MKWELVEPSSGDMIRVRCGDIYHYGVYVSDEEVIQFGLAPSRRASLKDSEIEVLASDVDTFLGGGFLETCVFDRGEKKKNRKAADVVRYARERIGMKGYNIIYNNCEHFANECVRGVHESAQTDAVRALFRQLPVVDVYVARIPENGAIGHVWPPEREADIARVSNERVKLEKYYVWRLLGYALSHSFGYRMESLKFTHHEDGRWSTDACHFSLSHSGSAVAVAVSRAPVGVDIEAPRALSYDRMADHMLGEREKVEYAALSPEQRAEYLLARWTAKEASFKSRHLPVFEPSKTEISPDRIKTDSIILGGERYVYSVATETPDRIRTFVDVDLDA